MSEQVQSMTGQQVLVSQTMTEEEVAKALNVPKSTIKNMRYAGEIPFVQVARGRPIYLVQSVLDWLKARESQEWTQGIQETTQTISADSAE